MAKEIYGTKACGATVQAFSLSAGGVSATILDMAGTITAITAPDRDGKPRNVVLGLKDLTAYEASGSWNCLIGRYANRLRNGITLDGRHYGLMEDENGITLHGGRGLSWGTRLWQVTSESQTSLGLRLLSADGDQGFPGNLTVDATFSVTRDALKLDYIATADAPTVINLTNHIYFNLAGSGSVTSQWLTLNADAITPTDAQQIPTGEFMDVTGTAFDLRNPTSIGARVDCQEPQMAIAQGFDHNFVLNKKVAGGLEWAATMSDPQSGIALEVSTTEPGLQVYSTNNVRPGKYNGAGNEIQRRDGLALETQHFPDSPNRPNFPSTLLRPGETFRSTTIYRLSVS
jgi:aldose 1-epimerase